MERITNYNWARLCCEKYCDNLETELIEINVKGLKILLNFCKKHAEEFEDKFEGFKE